MLDKTPSSAAGGDVDGKMVKAFGEKSSINESDVVPVKKFFKSKLKNLPFTDRKMEVRK